MSGSTSQTFPDLLRNRDLRLDELAPLFRRDAWRVVFGHVSHVHVRGLQCAWLGLALGPLAPGAIAVPSVVSDHLPAVPAPGAQPQALQAGLEVPRPRDRGYAA